MATKILFDDKCPDGNTINVAETAILYVDGDSYFRVIHRSKAHENTVVVSAVLRRTRFATNLEPREICRTTCTVNNGLAHSGYCIVVPAAVDVGVMLASVECVQLAPLYRTHNVRRVEETAVGNLCG